jgi:Zn ribbon nucleic-acid-binding protein
METRTKNSYQTFVYDFIKFDILVVCPSCSKSAIVKTNNFTYLNRNEDKIKVVCTNCGFNKRLNEKPESILSANQNKIITGRYIVIGGTVDPFFHMPLWFRTSFNSNELWAYNKEHIEFLKQHIEAKLRERNGQELANKSLGSRLPKWINTKNNREPLLKALTELQSK